MVLPVNHRGELPLCGGSDFALGVGVSIAVEHFARSGRASRFGRRAGWNLQIRASVDREEGPHFSMANSSYRFWTSSRVFWISEYASRSALNIGRQPTGLPPSDGSAL